MYSRRRNKQLILGFLTVVALVVVVGGIWKLREQGDSGSTVTQNPAATISPTADSIKDRISYGDRILINHSDNESKEFQALKNNKDFRQARYNPKFLKPGFEFSEFCANPEPLIYLNNAQIGKKESYTIAVVAPIENQRVAALEILRGVAQAQDDINKSATKINGKLLKVIIANEKEGDTTITEGIAKYLVFDDRDILGVIGHFSSGDTEKVVKIYGNPDLKENRLVLISSTSTKPNIDNQYGYFFRTVPNNVDEAEKLANYMFKNLNQQKAAIVFNDTKEYSKSLKNEFKTAVEPPRRKGKIFQFYDLSKGLNGDQIRKEAINSQTNVFMFAGSKRDILETISPFLDDQAQRFNYLAGDAMFDPSLIASNGDIRKRLRNMVIAVPWHYTDRDAKSQDFVKKYYQLWCKPQRSEISWRTATSYDATNALIEAIENNPNPTRETIQEVLSLNFTMEDEGVTGEISFKDNGDFRGKSKLVKLVEKNGASGTFYEFELLPDN